MKYSKQSLEIGIKVEMEHTKDREKAKKIALDHLAEDPDYYKDWDNKEKILFQEKAPKMNKSDDMIEAKQKEKLKKKQGVPKGVDPAKHERCVKEVKKQGKDKSSAYAICNASMKKSQENNMSNKIEQEIENLSKSMEDSSVDPREKTIELIKSLGPEGLKTVLPNLNDDQKAMLKSVLEEMNKGMDFEQVTPEKEMTKLENSGAELENGSDDEDEKVAKPQNAQMKNQGGSGEEGEQPWEGQVIKSKEEESDMNNSVEIDVDSIVDETLEKSYDMKKMRKDDDKEEKKEMKQVADKEVKDHEKQMHSKKMKKSKEDLIALKDEIVKSYEDAGLAYTNELIKGEMKKRLLAEESQVEMGGQDKGGKADRADKKAPKDIKVGEDADTKADDVKAPAMKKSIQYEKDETSLLKACTNGRNYHFSINNYYDEALRKSAEEGKETEDLKKSESEEEKADGINDLIEKSMDMDADTAITNHMLEQHKVNGHYSESFANVDLLDAMGLSEEDAAKILGEEGK